MIYDESAERTLLGALCFETSYQAEVLESINPSDFWHPGHREILKTMQKVHALKEPVAFLTVSSHLADESLKAHLFSIVEDGASASENMTLHCRKVVQDAATVRRVERHAKELLSAVAEGQSIEELLLKAENVNLRQTTEELTEWLNIPQEDEQRGITTGHDALDAVTGCGYPVGQVSVISAWHKGGKTSFLLDSFRSALAMEIPCVYATFADLTPQQLKRRALKNVCGLGGPPRVRLDLEEKFSDAYHEMHDPYGPWSLASVYDARVHGRAVETCCSKLKAAHRKLKFKALFVDYAQKVGTKEKTDKVRQMEAVSDAFDELAGQLGIAVILGSQITKGEGDEMVTKYARAIEEDAGLVIRLIRNEKGAFVEVPYNRFGPSAKFTAFWNQERVRYEMLRAVEA